MVSVEVFCPACSKMGIIEVSEETIRQNTRGVAAVNVLQDIVCKHSFVVYIDKNLAVRDCFITDFTIELPQIEMEEKPEGVEIPSTDEIDLLIISINLNALTIAYIIRGILQKKKILLLTDIEILTNYILNLMMFIFTNYFDYDILILNRSDYKKNKKFYKNHLILEDKKIVKDKSKILAPDKMRIETSIVEKFLSEGQHETSLIILKNEIQKIHDISQYLMEIITKFKGKENVGKKELIGELQKTKKIKITFAYLNFILEILKNYYNFDLSSISDYFFPAFGI
jgi:hypothetical protein